MSLDRAIALVPEFPGQRPLDQIYIGGKGG
jgi:hypothetical protein